MRRSHPFTPLFWKIFAIIVILVIFVLLEIEGARNRAQIERAENTPTTYAVFTGWQVTIIGAGRDAKVIVEDWGF